MAQIATDQLGMIYHDNEIEWSGPQNSSRIGIAKAAFTIKAFSITEGQDKDHKIKVDQEHVYSNITPNKLMTFKCGRKASKEVANWWNATFDAKETSFGHTAGELNFAFYGPLNLTVWTDDGSGRPDEKRNFTLPNFGLAQGHKSGYNNWWIAMKGASSKDGVLECVDETKKFTVWLRRSDNGVNNVWVTSLHVT